MLYYLFNYIDKEFDFPGAGVFQYISFRAGAAAVLSLLITITFGKKLIEVCCAKSVELGFTKIYLETLPELSSAIPLYERMGFEYVHKSLTGGEHFGCNLFMLKRLDN